MVGLLVGWLVGFVCLFNCLLAEEDIARLQVLSFSQRYG